MWVEQTPRQIHELLRTYRELHKEIDGTSIISKNAAKAVQSSGENYKVVGKNVKVPEWLKGRIPSGATVYDANTVTQEQMMSN